MDKMLVINAQFATGYRTGHYFNTSSMQTMPMRPSGTWMSQLSVRLVQDDDDSTLITISTQESGDIESALCGKACFLGGTVMVDGVAATTTGLMRVGEQTTVELINRFVH